jgi:hypothetical protein
MGRNRVGRHHHQGLFASTITELIEAANVRGLVEVVAIGVRTTALPR